MYMYMNLHLDYLNIIVVVSVFARLLGLDLTVRDDEGEVIESETIGAIELFRDHRHTVERSALRRKQPDIRSTQRHTLNLFVSVCNVICRVGDEADVIMALYDTKNSKFFRYDFVLLRCCPFVCHFWSVSLGHFLNVLLSYEPAPTIKFICTIAKMPITLVLLDTSI